MNAIVGAGMILAIIGCAIYYVNYLNNRQYYKIQAFTFPLFRRGPMFAYDPCYVKGRIKARQEISRKKSFHARTYVQIKCTRISEEEAKRHYITP